MKTRLQDQLQHLPDAPGVYLYRNEGGDILYIGKAKFLKKRVRSYFQPSANHNLRIRIMVSLAESVETILTNTEAEALILEAQLIKAHQPRYNVALKDDKSYPYLKLSTNEMFPRLFLVRESKEKHAEYFGPYTSSRDARHVMHVVNKFFPIRTSKMALDGTKSYRPCLNFQMKRCLAPCQGTVSQETYNEAVKQVRWFLQGRDTELIKIIEDQMKRASEQLDFERAAQLRDQIRAIQRLFKKQVLLTDESEKLDVFGFCRKGNLAGVHVLFLRYGRLLANDFFVFEDVAEVSDDNLIGQVLNRVYTGDSFVIPKTLLLPFAYSDQEIFAQTLGEQVKHRVTLHVPQRGEKKRLLEMAQNNAELRLEEHARQHDRDLSILHLVQKKLHLKFLPSRVEAFDISNISGTHSVASMVSWLNNRPDKANYRKFKIQSVEGPNDFASMQEVLTRRYQRCLEEQQPLPDLIIIDGGKGQLSIAVAVLTQLGISLDQVDVIGLAKGRAEKRRGRHLPREEDFEYVVKPNQKNEIRLPRNSELLYFLQRIRDESHRFAIEFHRQQRQKSMLHSVLDDIPGVGKQRKQKLLQHFGSLKKIQEASLEELQSLPGITKTLAQQIQQGIKS